MARTKIEGIIISYMGNTDGRDTEKQNQPNYVNAALKDGWHVCVTVLFQNGSFLLPHAPNSAGFGFSPMPPAFFSKPRVWAQALDAVTLNALCDINAHCFMWAPEEPTLTSAQFIWTPTGHALVDRSIACFPENTEHGWLADAEPAGICTEYPYQYI